MAGTGGARPGAGRKPSASTVRTRKVAEKLVSDGDITPLEVLALTMRAIWEKAVDAAGAVVNVDQAKEASAIAERLAPYMHPRLAAVVHTGEVEHSYVARVPEILESTDEWAAKHAPTAH